MGVKAVKVHSALSLTLDDVLDKLVDFLISALFHVDARSIDEQNQKHGLERPTCQVVGQMEMENGTRLDVVQARWWRVQVWNT